MSQSTPENSEYPFANIKTAKEKLDIVINQDGSKEAIDAADWILKNWSYIAMELHHSRLPSKEVEPIAQSTTSDIQDTLKNTIPPFPENILHEGDAIMTNLKKSESSRKELQQCIQELLDVLRGDREEYALKDAIISVFKEEHDTRNNQEAEIETIRQWLEKVIETHGEFDIVKPEVGSHIMSFGRLLEQYEFFQQPGPRPEYVEKVIRPLLQYKSGNPRVRALIVAS